MEPLNQKDLQKTIEYNRDNDIQIIRMISPSIGVISKQDAINMLQTFVELKIGDKVWVDDKGVANIYKGDS